MGTGVRKKRRERKALTKAEGREGVSRRKRFPYETCDCRRSSFVVIPCVVVTTNLCSFDTLVLSKIVLEPLVSIVTLQHVLMIIC